MSKTGLSCFIQKDTDGNVITVDSPFNGETSNLYKEADKVVDNPLDVWATAYTEKFKEKVYNPLLNKYKTFINKTLPNSTIKIVKKEVNGKLVYEPQINGKKAGALRLISYKDGYRVDGVVVYDKFQKQGVASNLYKLAIKDLVKQGKSLYSLKIRAPYADNIWKDLVKQGIAQQVGEDYVVRHFPPNFDENQEPKLKEVLDFIEKEKATPLNEKEIQDIKIALSVTNVKNSKELLKELEDNFIVNGVFQPNISKKTSFYTSAEYNEVLNNLQLQQDLKNLYYKLQKSPNIENDIQINPIFRSISKFKTNILGKLEEDNAVVNEQDALNILGGIKDRETFEQKLNENFPFLKPNSEELFQRFKTFQRVKEKTIVDGKLVDVKQNDTKTLFEQVLREDERGNLTEKLTKLLTYSPIVWNNNEEKIRVLLSTIKKSAINIGLDLQNIETKPLNEVRSFLNVLETTLRVGGVDNLAKAYDNLFQTQQESKYRVVKAPNKSIISIKGYNNEYKLFKDFGVLPIGNDLFMRTEALKKPLEQVYSEITQIKNTTVEKLKGEVRKEYRSINTKDQEVDVDVLEKMILLKNYFNTKFENIKPYPSIESEFNNRVRESIDVEDFISKFYIKTLQEKGKNSQAYSEFFSKFEITEQGIILKYPNDPQIKPYLKNIENYLKLNKENTIVFNGVSEDIIDGNFKRNYYANYPKVLPMYKGVYDKIDEETIKTASKEQFIRTNEGVFEGVSEGVFKKLIENNSQYKNYNLNDKPSLDSYEINTNNKEVEKNIKNLYSRTQSKEIDNNIAC